MTVTIFRELRLQVYPHVGKNAMDGLRWRVLTLLFAGVGPSIPSPAEGARNKVHRYTSNKGIATRSKKLLLETWYR